MRSIMSFFLALIVVCQFSTSVVAQVGGQGGAIGVDWYLVNDDIYNPNSGNVGVGTSTPDTKFHVFDDEASTYLNLETDGVAWESKVRFINGQGSWEAGINPAEFFEVRDVSAGNSVLVIEQNVPSNTLYLNSTGEVGIGTNTPAEKLSVSGNIKLTGALRGRADDNLNIYGNTNATDSRSWIELWGYHADRAGELTLAGTYLSFRYGSTDEFAGYEGMHLASNGNVGIGTDNPQVELQVNSTSTDSDVLRVQASDGENIIELSEFGNGQGAIDVKDTNGNIAIRLNSEGNSYFTGMNVGIGTSSPAVELDVNGTIQAEEIIVQTSGADFVFEDDYALPSLDQVEQHIKENKHLPDIPSAKEVQANGVSLGQMQTNCCKRLKS